MRIKIIQLLRRYPKLLMVACSYGVYRKLGNISVINLKSCYIAGILRIGIPPVPFFGNFPDIA